MLRALVFLALATGSARSADFDPAWEVVSSGHKFAEGLALDAANVLHFTDVGAAKLFRVEPDGEVRPLDGDTRFTNGLSFGPDGHLYGAGKAATAIFAWNPENWQRRVVNEGATSNDLVVHPDGSLFFTDPDPQTVWRVDRDGKRTAAAVLDWRPNGINLGPDGRTLFVAEFRGETIHAFPVAEDGELGPSRPAYRLEVPEDGQGLLDGLQVLGDGTLLVGTALGLQVAWPLDSGGGSRVLPADRERPRCNYVRLSPDRKWLYAAYVDSVLRRPFDPKLLEKKP